MCKSCNSIYDAQAEKSAKIHLSQHLNDIKRFIPFKERNSCVATHFKIKGYNCKENFLFFIFKEDFDDQNKFRNLNSKFFLSIKFKLRMISFQILMF